MSNLTVKSSSCSIVGTYGMQISLCLSLSYMKWRSTSMCFILSYCTRPILIAVLSSQNNFTGLLYTTVNSSRTFWSQMTSQNSLHHFSNSVLALLLVTTFCFLLHQVTKYPHIRLIAALSSQNSFIRLLYMTFNSFRMLRSQITSHALNFVSCS